MSDLLDKAKAQLEKFVGEMTSSGDYSTQTAKRDNNVKKAKIATYEGRADGSGAAERTVDVMNKHHKDLADL